MKFISILPPRPRGSSDPKRQTQPFHTFPYFARRTLDPRCIARRQEGFRPFIGIERGCDHRRADSSPTFRKIAPVATSPRPIETPRRGQIAQPLSASPPIIGRDNLPRVAGNPAKSPNRTRPRIGKRFVGL